MKMLCIELISFALIGVAIIGGCSKKDANASADESFDSTVSVHLRAIATANLEQLDPTVDDSVTMISPFGSNEIKRFVYGPSPELV